MLEASGLVKRYGGVAALDGFDLRVAEGEIAGLVGPNGAGKSTFVEIVAGLTRADSGRVTVQGIDVARRPASVRRLVGVAPQEIGLYPSLTVRENIRLFGGLAGVRGAALRRSVAATADALSLGEVLDRQVGHLSGGQLRRTQAATALSHRPRLLLLDEPTAGADPETRSALLRLVRDLAAAGTTVCYTTHYLPELVELDATLAVVASGRVVARGSRQALLADLPSELRVTTASGATEVTRTKDPTTALAELLAAGHVIRSVDIRHPSIDDLYLALRPGRHLAAG